MNTNINSLLDRYDELATKVFNYTDKFQKKTAFENILSKIKSVIPDAIGSNLQAIQCYTKYYFQDYRRSKFTGGLDTFTEKTLIRFVDENFNDIQLYENDNEEKRRERKVKSDELRQTITVKDCNGRVINNPDNIYWQYGTYTQYLSFKEQRYFPICLKIKKLGCTYFEGTNYLVLLYIALNNELHLNSEELELLGINTSNGGDKYGNDIPKRTIKTDIRKLFKQKLNNRKLDGTNVSESDVIIEKLKINRASNKDYARIALIFYNSKFIERKNDMFFKDFLLIFYDLIGIEHGTPYKENQLIISKKLSTEFQYLL